MLKIILSSLLSLMLMAPLLSGAERPFVKDSANLKVFVNNRILACINGKPISTHDVVKKMDMLFYEEFPEYTSLPEARYHFYLQNWKHVLEDLMTKELILADAQESKIEVSSGDVRQEMEKTFGPNIIINLDKVGLSYDEAFKIVQGDIIIKRMLGGRVHAKVLRQVTPAYVRQAYDEFLQNPKNCKLTLWRYQVMTFKDSSLTKCGELAAAAFQLLLEGIQPEDLATALKSRKLLGKKGKVTVSAVIENNEQELSDNYRSVLSSLEPGMYSQPFMLKSRVEKTTVYRILLVKEKEPGGFPPFREIEGRMKDHLINRALDQETDLYIEKLRQHYHVREADLQIMIPEDYTPFILK